MTDNEQPPIEAPTPWVDQAWAALRQAAPIIMAFALGRNWISGDVGVLLGGVAGIVWPVIVGQLKTRHRANQIVAIRDDPRVPAEVVK